MGRRDSACGLLIIAGFARVSCHHIIPEKPGFFLWGKGVVLRFTTALQAYISEISQTTSKTAPSEEL
jgi:hypothetical protein